MSNICKTNKANMFFIYLTVKFVACYTDLNDVV